MTVVDFASLDLGDRLGKGGQGSVHRVRNQQINQQWPVVYKEYLPAVLPSVRIDALRQMADLVPSLPYADGIWLAGETSWPAALVEKQGRISGLLMRAVPDEFQFDFRTLGASGETRKLANVEFLLNPDAYVANIGLRISERDRLRLLAAIAGTLDRLHGLDIAVGDLSPKNLLFSTSPETKCFVIDCDAMRLRGVSAMEQVETPGWQIPRGEEKATRHSDAYKFALLAVRMFARDQTTADTGPLGRISANLEQLARDGLRDDAARRPPPGGWIDELKIAASKASTSHARAANSASGKATGAAGQRQGTGAPFTISPLVSSSPGSTRAQPSATGSARPLAPGATTSRPVPQLRRRRITIASVLLAAMATTGIGLGIYNANHASGANSAVAVIDEPTYGSDISADPANGGGNGTDTSVLFTDVSEDPSPSLSSSPSPQQTTVGLVQISAAIAADPRASQVAQMFDTYFSGIDQKDYQQALAEYDPSGVINPSDSNQAKQFEQGVATSNDTDVQLLKIQPDDQSSPVTSVDVTFQSTQSAGQGPADNPSETCTHWSLTYKLTQSSSGGYLINDTPVASDTGC
ncbi:MAG TPA: hypothetical protein VFU65_11010 [Actinocrinis sp.]|nr:hypothetical protein [Actinocrinis sp.]